MNYFIMGVSGSGKSTIGILLAQKLNIPFYDGDDFHSQKNVEKMRNGLPLNDDDREEWLISINRKARENSKGAVFTCSALKEKYRRIIFSGIENSSLLIYLYGDFDIIYKRIENRQGHFMPAKLLQSQFEILEEPEYGIKISIENSPNEIVYKILRELNPSKQEFGLIGLGVMGKSLARNLAGKGFRLALYNRFVEGKEEQVANEFIGEHAELKHAIGFENLREFVERLEKPRKIFLMVNAGKITDKVINELTPLLDNGDILIDGGNSHYHDTENRIASLSEAGIRFIGAGVSGGEEGALKGPSIMPGGSKDAYKEVSRYLEAIAAKDRQGNSCCSYIGKGGAGHFVKMIHNGIEYAEMQLLAECYAVLRFINGLSPTEISAVLRSWENENLGGYLLEITSKLLQREENGVYLIDLILDKAGNKGTGSWTTIAMAELGIPATLISSALFARYISSFSTQRSAYATHFNMAQPEVSPEINPEDLQKAYAIARLVNHQQGFGLIREASEKYGWELNLPELARIWTNGCIIRSELMESLAQKLKINQDILLQYPSEEIKNGLLSLRQVSTSGLNFGLSMPTFLSALDYLNAHFYPYPTANIIQAQRDFFGAHTYQRVDDPSGKYYHTIWE
jgi:6-phosphogluconate dehydrogenase